MAWLGMNLETVSGEIPKWSSLSEEVGSIINNTNTQVQAANEAWNGTDSDQFVGDWNDKYRPALEQIKQMIDQLVDQLTQIHQDANVSNSGSAHADSGGNSASANVHAGVMDETAPDSASMSAVDLPSVFDPNPDSPRSMLLWGPAPGNWATVWVLVDGRFCKQASVAPDPDVQDGWYWYTRLEPRDCGVTDQSQINFVLGLPMSEQRAFDIQHRESPEIVFSALNRLGLLGGKR